MATLSAATMYQSHFSVQSSSDFFTRLPREIRDLVYKEVIRAGGLPVHLFLNYHRSICRRGSLGVKLIWDPKLASMPFTQTFRSGRIVGLDRARENDLSEREFSRYKLTWLLCCKRIFNEAFHLLYFVPTVWIHDIHTLESLWATLPPRCFSKIHSLHLEVATPTKTDYKTNPPLSTVLDSGRWATLSETVAAMKGLRTLHVKLSNRAWMNFSPDTNRDILEQFMTMKGPQNFTVYIGWFLGEQFVKKYQGNAPFDLSCIGTYSDK